MNIKTDIPELQVTAQGLANWEEIQAWAFNNDILWHRLEQFATYHKLSEVERLRLLSAGLLTSLVDCANQIIARRYNKPLGTPWL